MTLETKIELVDGKILGSGDISTRNTLGLLITPLDIRECVKLAPTRKWLQALTQNTHEAREAHHQHMLERARLTARAFEQEAGAK